MLLRIVSLFPGALLAAVLMLGSASKTVAQENYVIRPGDTLQIEVLEDPGLNRTTLVLPDGTISFPMAGTVRTNGRSVEQLRQSLSSALAPNFASAPNVYVSIASLSQARAASSGGSGSSRTMDVYILGEVTAPGKKGISRGTTILQFLAESGGLTRFAAEKRIELHRTNQKTGVVSTYLFNYRSPGGGAGGINGSTKLAPGDVVKIPQRGLFE